MAISISIILEKVYFVKMVPIFESPTIKKSYTQVSKNTIQMDVKIKWISPNRLWNYRFEKSE